MVCWNNRASRTVILRSPSIMPRSASPPSRIGRRHGEDRQTGLQGDGLGQPDSGAAADGYDAVRLSLVSGFKAAIGNRLRHMNDSLRVQRNGTGTEEIAYLFAEPLATAGCRHDKNAADLQLINLVSDAGECAGGEDDAL